MQIVIGIGGTLLGLIFIGWYFLQKRDNKSNELSEKQGLVAFKLQSEAILVHLKDCEIRSCTEKATVVRRKGYIGPNASYLEEVFYNASILIYTTTRFDKKEVYTSRSICIDKLSLQTYLNVQQNTFLYVNQEDKNLYYFDLEFLRDDQFSYPGDIYASSPRPIQQKTDSH